MSANLERLRASVLWLALVCLCALPATVSGREISGQLQLLEKGKNSRRAAPHSAIVYYLPKDPPPVPVPPEEPFEIVTVRKQFEPRVLAVPPGSRVRFPNQDPILHNVFSVSAPNRFDLGLYARGQAEETTLEHPGIVRVFCNVHHSMVAYVLVLATPFHTQPDRAGNFRLSDLPEGPGTLMVWHERAEVWSQEMNLTSDAALTVQLQLTRPAVPPHKNKFGRRYRRARRDAY